MSDENEEEQHNQKAFEQIISSGGGEYREYSNFIEKL